MLGGIRRAPAIVVLVLSLFLATALAWAAPGDLDTTFGEGGKVVTDLQSGDSFASANALAVQDDDRLVAVGFTKKNFEEADFAVVRYRTNGGLDTDFGRNGTRIFGFGDQADQANDVALLPSGKILVAGFADDGSKFAVARITKGGKLDRKFSGDGKVTFTFPNATGNVQAEGIAVQEDGRIVVVGHTSAKGGDRFAVARLTKGGKLDDTFSGDGRAFAEFPGFIAAQGFDVAIQENGRIVMSGYAFDGEALDFALTRFRAGGTPDTSFDADGFRTDDIGGQEDVAFAVKIDPGTGRIVAAGRARTAGDGGDFGVARYLSDGSPDEGFSGDGFVMQAAGDSVVQEEAEDLVILPSGAVVAAGVTGPGFASTNFAVMRFTSAGVLDSTFSPSGTAGIEVTDFGGTQDHAYGLVRQSSGRLVAAGSGEIGNDFFGFALAGYLGS